MGNKNSVRILQAKEQDVNRILALSSECFECSLEEIDALQLKLKEDRKRFATSHFYIEEAGEMIATAAIFKDHLIVQDKTLSVGCVGDVCVKKEYRNQNVMQQLMQYANQKLKEENYDLAYLGGKRDRYNHFGFELATNAQDYMFTMQEAYIHDKIELKRMSLVKEEDIRILKELYDTNVQRIDRTPYDFIHVCKTWNSDCYGIYLDKKMVGYMIYLEELFGESNIIQEFELQDMSLLQDVLVCFLKMKKKNQVVIRVGGYEQAKIACLEEICQNYGVRATEMYQFVNYETCIKTLLELKQRMVPLERGHLVLEIVPNKKIAITVDKEITVQKTEEIPDITVSALGAMNLLVHLGEFVPNNSLTKSWFPLPIYVKNADAM